MLVVVVIRNGEHLCGVLDKSSLGSGSKSNIFYLLMRDHGEQVFGGCHGDVGIYVNIR